MTEEEKINKLGAFNEEFTPTRLILFTRLAMRTSSLLSE